MKVPSGRYSGTSGRGQEIRFSVSVSGDGRRIYGLTVVYDPRDCLGSGPGELYVAGRGSSVRIGKDGSVSVEDGMRDSPFWVRLTGKFHGGTIQGTIAFRTDSCLSPPSTWRAGLR